MKRREFIKNTGAVLIGTDALAASSVKSQGQQGPKRPNILHIMSDQQQWATIAGRSQCNTLNLDRLAAGGMLFERAYTPCAVCCPARAMLATGVFHWHNGVFNQVHSAPSVHRDMYPDVTTYSMRLAESGYRLGYVGKWHASFTRTPLDFGYHEIGAPISYNRSLLKGLNYTDERRRGKLKETVVRKMSWPGSEPFSMWGYLEGDEEDTNMWGVAETGIKMMNRFTARKQPWMIEIQFREPHDDYTPLKKYLDRYESAEIPVARSFREENFKDKPGVYRMESESWGEITEEDFRESRAHYYAYCEMLDAQIGRVLDELERIGEVNNTVVVFTTDHGDMVGAHRMWIKGIQPFEECYRVPLIIRWPGRIEAGVRCNHLVQTHDLAHTYTEIAGAPALPFADGTSLTMLFDNPSTDKWRNQILCAYYGGEFLYTQRMAITDHYKYVFNGFDIDECYDLHTDPDELVNRIGDPAYRPIVNDMRARLYELMNDFEDPFGDTQNRISIGEPPNRYGAPRFLPRGKRI